MSKNKPPSPTKCGRACLEAARETLGKGWTITLEHGGRHAVHLHVVHNETGSLWRVPVSTGGNRDEKAPARLVARRCAEILTGRWGCQPA